MTRQAGWQEGTGLEALQLLTSRLRLRSHIPRRPTSHALAPEPLHEPPALLRALRPPQRPQRQPRGILQALHLRAVGVALPLLVQQPHRLRHALHGLQRPRQSQHRLVPQLLHVALHLRQAPQGLVRILRGAAEVLES